MVVYLMIPSKETWQGPLMLSTRKIISQDQGMIQGLSQKTLQKTVFLSIIPELLPNSIGYW